MQLSKAKATLVLFKNFLIPQKFNGFFVPDVKGSHIV